jgi:hypothetical protein
MRWAMVLCSVLVVAVGCRTADIGTVDGDVGDGDGDVGDAAIADCFGLTGACIDAHISSDVSPLDQLRIDLAGAGGQFAPSVPNGPLTFPISVALVLPPGSSSGHLDLYGLFAGTIRAHAAADVAVPASNRLALDVTLEAFNTNDGSSD